MYDGLCGRLPTRLQKGIEVFNVTKRRNRLFKISYSRTNIKLSCTIMVGAKLFNALPQVITGSKCRNSLKSNYKRYCLDKY